MQGVLGIFIYTKRVKKKISTQKFSQNHDLKEFCSSDKIQFLFIHIKDLHERRKYYNIKIEKGVDVFVFNISV